MTGDQLVEHRLKQLEDGQVGSRTTEREVDLLKIESATIKSLLVELQTEVRSNDAHTRSSLARLHERLDAITVAQARDEGAQSERMRLWKALAVTVPASAAVASVIVAVVALFHP